MAISQQQRTELLTLLVGMFDAAPGSDILDELANGIDAGNTIAQYAANLVESSEFTGIYSRALTAEEFATSFIANLLGDTVSAETTTEAEAFVAGRLNAGASRDTVIIEALTALSAVSEDDATWGAAVAQLNNKVEVAEYFGTQTQYTGLTLSQMQAALNGVTSDDATVTAKKEAIDSGDLEGVGASGETFTLTIGEDAGASFTGGATNDTFTASLLQNNNAVAVNSLEDFDVLDGGEGTDTLNVTLASSDASDSVAPILKNLEEVNVRFTGDDNLSLANSTGVNTVNVAQSTTAMSVTGLGSVAALSVSDQTVDATFSGSTATSLTLGVSDISKAVAVDLADAAATTLTLNLDSVGAKSAAGAITNVTLDQNAATATAVTANLTGDNYVTATNILDAAKTATVAGTGSLTLSGSATLAALETLNVSGSASVDVDAITAGALKTVAAGSTSGDVAVKVDATATSVTTGSGDDTVTYTAALAADSSVNLGAGDDVLVVTGNDKTASVDGGAGTDVLAATSANFTTILADADKPKSYTNFETLKVTDAMANSSSVDVSKVAGVTNFIAGAGVAAGGTATATGLGANTTVEIAGANTAVAAVNAVYTLDFAGAATNDAGDTVTIEGITAYTAVGADDASTIAAGVRAGGTISIGGVTYDITGTGTQAILTAQTADATNATFDLLVVDDAAEGGITQATTTTFDPSTDGVVAVASGTLNLVAKTDTSDDTVNLVLNQDYTENNDTTATVTALTSTVDASKFETVSVESTGNASATFAGAEGNKADGVNNTLALTNNDLVTLNVSGDQKLTFNALVGMEDLATVDASANTAGVVINVSAATAIDSGVTITGTAAADTITGSDLGDTITLGGGNDTVVYSTANSVSQIGTGKFDTITDFSANTYGNGTDGAAGTGAAADTTKWTGDVLQFTAGTNAGGVDVDVLSTAADATTYLANNGAANTLVAALDSSTGNLYVDNTGDGVADFFIQLSGVTTINEAAFVLV